MALPIGGKIVLDTNVFIDFPRTGMHAEWVIGGHCTIVRIISAIVCGNFASVLIPPNGKRQSIGSIRRFIVGVCWASLRPSSNRQGVSSNLCMGMRHRCWPQQAIELRFA